jgi:holo-[acyl-carrier protein] synthase
VKVGLDLIEIQRIHDALERYPGFRERCFTEAEREYCDSRANPAQHYAARFAGKEAVGKALGFGVARAFAWKDVEIAGRPKPAVRLSGRVEAWSANVGAGEIDLSMTHSKGMAAAVAVVTKNPFRNDAPSPGRPGRSGDTRLHFERGSDP